MAPAPSFSRLPSFPFPPCFRAPRELAGAAAAMPVRELQPRLVQAYLAPREADVQQSCTDAPEGGLLLRASLLLVTRKSQLMMPLGEPPLLLLRAPSVLLGVAAVAVEVVLALEMSVILRAQMLPPLLMRPH